MESISLSVHPFPGQDAATWISAYEEEVVTISTATR
jgi:hypothetical protein